MSDPIKPELMSDEEFGYRLMAATSMEAHSEVSLLVAHALALTQQLAEERELCRAIDTKSFAALLEINRLKDALTAERAAREAAEAELETLRAYQRDAGDRFEAIVRQRMEAEADAAAMRSCAKALSSAVKELGIAYELPYSVTFALESEAWINAPHPGSALLSRLAVAEEVAGKLQPKFPTGDGFMLVTFKHGFVGNDVSLWGPKSSGYTCMLDEAGVYTREEAAKIHNPPEVYAVPVADVIRMSRAVVEIQRCGGKKAIEEASAAALAHPETKGEADAQAQS